mmetsp:Transcript_18698/g.56464  ORF Transcript_18698/g.56464 Transcript_18698/m.56464 type:complete len:127 (+) Transcript_18698:122-502(+)
MWTFDGSNHFVPLSTERDLARNRLSHEGQARRRCKLKRALQTTATHTLPVPVPGVSRWRRIQASGESTGRCWTEASAVCAPAKPSVWVPSSPVAKNVCVSAWWPAGNEVCVSAWWPVGSEVCVSAW